MVNTAKMWQSYQGEISERMSHEVVKVIKKLIEQMPEILANQLEFEVTTEGLYVARIWIADEFVQRGAITELAQAEVSYPPIYVSRRFNYTERILYDSYAYRFANHIHKNLKLIQAIRNGTIDGPTTWEISDCPKFNPDQIILRRELNPQARALLRAGSLNYSSLLETQAGALFPLLRV